MHPNPRLTNAFCFRSLVLGIWIPLFLGLTAGNVFGKTEAEIRTAIEDAIAVRHPKDTLEWWRGLGPQTPKILIQMYTSTSHIYHRMRLLQALAAFDDPEAVAFLKQEASKTPDDVIRNAAIRAVGVSQGGKEREWLASQLDHTDPNTRIAAFEALRASGDPQSRELANRHLQREKTDWARGKMKGEAPALPAKLPVVGSSEDRLRGDIEGKWRGVWMGPEWRRPGEVRAERVELELIPLEMGAIRGNLKSRREAKLTWVLENGKGKGSKFSGEWYSSQAKAFKSTLLKERLSFEAEVKSYEGEPVLLVRFASEPGIMLMRKSRP